MDDNTADANTFSDIFPENNNMDYPQDLMMITPVTPAIVVSHGDSNQASIDALQHAMFSYFQQMSSRIDALESFVTQIHELISQKRQIGQTVIQNVTNMTPAAVQPEMPAKTPIHAHADVASQPPQPAVSNFPVQDSHETYEFALEMYDVSPEFFTERHFPPFTVKLIDLKTNEVYRPANDWCVYFRLVDGYDRYVDEKLGDEKTKRQFLINGQTEVNGLKIRQVSSKNGGFFILEAILTEPVEMSHRVRPARSDQINILSCRLFQCRKGSLSRLEGLEPISKLPGIGRQYAQRLQEQGYRTIQDLANISLEDRDTRHQLLLGVRRDKGTLTDAKLIDYIRQAKSIVTGAFKRPREGDFEETPTKKICMDEPYFISEVPEANMYEYLNASFVENPDSPEHLGVGFGYTDFTSRAVGDIERCQPSSGVSLGHSVSVSPLLLAVACRKLSLVKYTISCLQERRAPLDPIDNNPLSALMFAASLGDCDIVRYLASVANIHPDQSRADGWTALHFAVNSGNLPCVQDLLEVVKNYKARTISGWTPLMIAIVRKDSAVVNALLSAFEKSASQDLCGNSVQSFSIFQLAALSGNVASIEALAEFSPSDFSHALKDFSNEIPSLMHCAAFSGNGEMIMWLIGHESPVDIECTGWNPLHVAAARHSTSCVRALAKVVPIDAVTSEGWNALSLCSMAAKETEKDAYDAEVADCVTALLDAGASSSNGAVPASVVSVVCSNMDALLALHSADNFGSQVRVQGKLLDIVALGKAVGEDDMADLLDMLISS